FLIPGHTYHRIGPMTPERGETPRYLQLYFSDPAYELALRRSHFPGEQLQHDTLSGLREMLRLHHPYVRLFEEAARPGQTYSIVFRTGSEGHSVDRRRYNAPETAAEIGAIIVDDSVAPTRRDIVVRRRGGGVQHIDATRHPSYAPLHYVLLHVRGEPGWELGILHRGRSGRRTPQRRRQRSRERSSAAHSTVTLREWTAFYFAVRTTSHFHFCGRLFQEWAVDMWANAEASTLAFLRANQRQLRRETYAGLVDHLHRGDGAPDETAGAVGVLLPSSFHGGPRFYYQLYADAMAIVRARGIPDLFITFTCNPKWREITENLHAIHNAKDRFDIELRVF
ncbi:unnamed protein product, partial [Phaeothamnion confervicola]